MIPMRGAGATPLINPAVVNPGQVTEVTVTSFPPGRDVSITWVDPVSLTAGGFAEPARAEPTTEDGTFRIGLVVFPNSRIGGRILMAVVDGFTATKSFLVAAGAAQGPDFIPRR